MCVNLQLFILVKIKFSKNSHLLSILVISSSYCIVELQYQRGNSDRKMSSELTVSLLSCLNWAVDLTSCILNISLIFWRGVRRLSFCSRLLFHSEISSNLHFVNIGPPPQRGLSQTRWQSPVKHKVLNSIKRKIFQSHVCFC